MVTNNISNIKDDSNTSSDKNNIYRDEQGTKDHNNSLNSKSIIKPKKRNYFTNKYGVILITLFCAILWGSAFPVLKVSYVELGIAANDLAAIIVFAGLRFFMSGIIIFGVIILGLRLSPFGKKGVYRWLFLIGLLQISIQYFFFYIGLAHTSGMKAAILSSSGVFFVVLFAHFVYVNDRLDWRKVIGLVAGFAGIVTINAGKNFTFDFTLMGEGFMLLSGLVSGIGTILAKKVSQEVHPFVLTAWQMLLGSLVLIAVGLPGLKPHAIVFTNKGVLLIIYAAFLSATAFSLWYAVLQNNKAGEVTVYKFMTPVSGAFLSAAFIPGEHVTVSMFVALALVSAGVIIVNYQRKIPKEGILREGPY